MMSQLQDKEQLITQCTNELSEYCKNAFNNLNESQTNEYRIKENIRKLCVKLLTLIYDHIDDKDSDECKKDCEYILDLADELADISLYENDENIRNTKINALINII